VKYSNQSISIKAIFVIKDCQFYQHSANLASYFLIPKWKKYNLPFCMQPT